MKNVTITEASGYMPGTLHTQLTKMGVIPQLISGPGELPVVFRMQMTDEQIRHFQLRGAAHKMVIEEAPVVDARDARIAELQAALGQRDERIAELEEALKAKKR